VHLICNTLLQRSPNFVEEYYFLAELWIVVGGRRSVPTRSHQQQQQQQLSQTHALQPSTAGCSRTVPLVLSSVTQWRRMPCRRIIIAIVYSSSNSSTTDRRHHPHALTMMMMMMNAHSGFSVSRHLTTVTSTCHLLTTRHRCADDEQLLSVSEC